MFSRWRLEVPSLVHGCGAKLKFPEAMAGRHGKCPTCGERVAVPLTPPLAPPASRPAPGRIVLDPPPHWELYQAFIDGKGPNPRPVVVPANLMLKEDADAKWEIGVNRAQPSKFACPGCKTRLDVGALVCTHCGL